MKYLLPILLALCACQTQKSQTIAQEFAVMHAMSASVGMDTADEVAHAAGRIINIAEDWIEDPTPSESMASGMRSMANYLVNAATRVEAELRPDPPVVRPPTGVQDRLVTQLDGLPLPGRPSVDIKLPRTSRYASVVDNAERDYGGQFLSGVTSSGILMKRNASITNTTIFGSGGDAMKFDGGEFPGNIRISRVHAFGLGLAPGAHADGFQSRGNLQSAVFTDCFFDQPTNRADGTRSNACAILNTDQGPDGTVLFERCIFRGGNRSIMMSKKGTSNKLADVTFKDCAFIVERNSPRYTLLQPGMESSFKFEGNCAVYYFNRDTGKCEFLTEDVANFHVLQWHTDMFGTVPAN